MTSKRFGTRKDVGYGVASHVPSDSKLQSLHFRNGSSIWTSTFDSEGSVRTAYAAHCPVRHEKGPQ
jgi:hypothetical protein